MPWIHVNVPSYWLEACPGVELYSHVHKLTKLNLSEHEAWADVMVTCTAQLYPVPVVMTCSQCVAIIWDNDTGWQHVARVVMIQDNDMGWQPPALLAPDTAASPTYDTWTHAASHLVTDHILGKYYLSFRLHPGLNLLHNHHVSDPSDTSHFGL